MITALRPYPAYKDSGVPWLGQVPAHWEVRRLGLVTHILNGATPSSSRPEYWDGHIVWITPDDLGKLKSRYIDNSARRITQEAYNACSTTLAPAGSIVISTAGTPFGKLGLLRVAACAGTGCRILLPHPVAANEYLYHVLAVSQPTLAAFAYGSTIPGLSHAKLKIFPIPLPPLHEQTAIVRCLDYIDLRIRRSIRAMEKLISLLEEYRQVVIQRTVSRKSRARQRGKAMRAAPRKTAVVDRLDAITIKLEAAIAAGRREIELLREYRERLFADVVTGKVDVREVAPRLRPDPPPPDGSDIV